MPRATPATIRTIRCSSSASGLGGASTLPVSDAISASRVCPPVLATTPSAVPMTRNVPPNTVSPGGLDDRFAFAGEHRFVHRAARGERQPQVRRHPVPGNQHDGVAGHQLGGVHLDDAVVPAHRDHGGQQLPQLGGGVLGALLLDVGEYPVHHDHHDDGDAQLRHPGDEGEGGRHPEHDGKKVGQLCQQPPPARHGADLGQPVRPVALQPQGSLRRAQSGNSGQRPGRGRVHRPPPVMRST